MAGFLSRIFGSAEAREDREARRMLESHVKQLESELKQKIESINYPDRILPLWELYPEYNRWLAPAGQQTDRKAGQNYPVIFNEDQLRQARAFCRILGDTNPVVIGFLNHVTNYVVGPGFKWQVSLRGQQKSGVGTNKEQDPRVTRCQQILDEFRQINGWGDCGALFPDDDLEADDSPQANYEREIYFRAERDGEAFVRLFKGGTQSNGIPLLRVVEPECVRAPNGETTGPDAWGIRVDEQDSTRRLGYYVTDPDGEVGQGNWVQAGRIVHLKLNVDAAIKRGLPSFFPIQDEAADLRKLWQNMGAVSAILSAIAYIREHAPGVSGTQITNMLERTKSGDDTRGRSFWDNNSGSDRTRLFTRTDAGQVIDVSNQMKYTPGPINSGIPGFTQAMQAVLRIVGLRWGCPEYFSGDSSNANFASTLVAGGPFERATQVRQFNYKQFQTNLALRVLMLAVASGRLDKADAQAVEVLITPPAVAIANKSEDTQRRATLNQARVLSPQTWAQEEGLDPDQEAANFKAFDAANPQGGAGADPMAALMGAASGSGGEQQPAEQAGDNAPPAEQPAEQPPEELNFSELFESQLVQKVITDKLGRKSRRMVRADADQPAPTKQTTQEQPKTTDSPKTVDGNPVPAEIVSRVSEPGRMQRFAEKVSGLLFRANDLMESYGLPAIEAVFDTPSDLQKFGYAATSVVDAGRGLAAQDPIRAQFGVSAHVAANLLTKALSAVWARVKARKAEGLEPYDLATWEQFLIESYDLLGLPLPDGLVRITESTEINASDLF